MDVEISNVDGGFRHEFDGAVETGEPPMVLVLEVRSITREEGWKEEGGRMEGGRRRDEGGRRKEKGGRRKEEVYTY